MRFLYLDPGLVNDLGHHAFYCRLIVGELRSRGVETKVFAFQKLGEALQREFEAAPHFRSITYNVNDGDPICGWLSGFFSFSQITREDLTRLGKVDASDVVFMTSALPIQFMAMVDWLRSMPPSKAPTLAIELMVGTESRFALTAHGVNLADPRPVLFRFVSTRVPRDHGYRLHLLTFDRTSSRVFSDLLGRHVHTLPFPYRAITPRLNRAGKRPIVVATLGHQRPAKGYHLMPEIAEALLRSRDDIRLLVHSGLREDVLKGRMKEVHQAMRDLAAREPRLILESGIAGRELWPKLLEKSDLVLCPYDPQRYVASYSAVAVEAITNGIPVVGPASTSMEALLREFGGPGTTFDQHQVTSIVAAANRVLDDFERYANLAHRASLIWPEIYGPNRMVDSLFALIGGPPTSQGAVTGSEPREILSR